LTMYIQERQKGSDAACDSVCVQFSLNAHTAHKVERLMRDCWTRSHTDSSCNNDDHEWFLF